MTRAEYLAWRCGDHPQARRYGRIAAEWERLRLLLRSGGGDDDREQFAILTGKLRTVTAGMDLERVTAYDRPRVVRVGDNRTFRAEPIAGITGNLGHLPVVEKLEGWILGMTWQEAATAWQE